MNKKNVGRDFYRSHYSGQCRPIPHFLLFQLHNKRTPFFSNGQWQLEKNCFNHYEKWIPSSRKYITTFLAMLFDIWISQREKSSIHTDMIKFQTTFLGFNINIESPFHHSIVKQRNSINSNRSTVPKQIRRICSDNLWN